MTTINDLSNEILIKIFSYIHVQERQRFETVCQRWGAVIQMMWQTIHKLIMKIGSEESSYSGWEGASWANILISNTLNAVEVLKKFDGNLTKLDLEYDIFAIIPPARARREMLQLCKEIQKNKQLNFVRISCSQSDRTLQLPFLEYLPIKNLQYLSLSMTQYDYIEEFIESLEALVEATSSLKYLYVGGYPPQIIGILDKIDTLESWHMGKMIHFQNLPAPKISKFTHLKELTMHYSASLNDEFFTALGTNRSSLRALELSLPFHEILSQSAFECIEKLENLSYLSLFLDESKSIHILSELSNLEYLYISFDYEMCLKEIQPSLQYVLKQLPKLKQCWFFDDDIHEWLESDEIVDGAQLQEPEDLHFIVWKRIFGIPQDDSWGSSSGI